MDTTPQQGSKISLESLSKEEIIQKYKGLLGIAKKAKQSKDEIAEENRKLKEQLQLHGTQKDADKKALITMKEMLEAYTENKLELTTQVAELQRQHKLDNENVEELSIKNESLKRQLQRLTEDNESLLTDIGNMESQLQQVGGLGKAQKQHIQKLETEIHQLKEAKIKCSELQAMYDELSCELEELKEKYKFIKDINAEQRHKFNSLKDKFIQVHKKVKKLKECRRILLETQHEYSNSVSQWQNEIIKASKVLCQELNGLKKENSKLLQNLNKEQAMRNIEFNLVSADKLDNLLELSEKAKRDYNVLLEENAKLKENLGIRIGKFSHSSIDISIEKLDNMWQLSKTAFQEYHDLQEENLKLKDSTTGIINKQQLQDKINLLEEEKQHFEIQYVELLKVNNENIEFKEKIQQLSISLSKMKDELIVAQNTSREYQEMYKQKEIEHHELLGEMRELNEALKARGDHISRQQEEYQILKNKLEINSEKLSNIQQEIDRKNDQLNEKQSKLESVMKETELTKHQLQSLEISNALSEEKIRILSAELENLKSNASAANDLDNQSDILSTSTTSKADELQRLKDVEDSFEDKYNKIRGLAAKLKKKLHEETALKQKLEKEMQEIRTRENKVNTQLTELQDKLSKVDILQKQLNEKDMQIDTLKGENQKLKSSRKQANVLNLEIEAAEKSLTEVTNKLTSRTSELDVAQDLIKSKESTIVQLKKEIVLLEESKASEIKHSQELKQQIDHLHKTLRDEIHSKQQAYDKSKILERDVENLKLELENVKLELAQSTSNQETLLQSINNEKEQLSQQLSAANAAVSNIEQKLKMAERAREDLRIEYLDYKVKAQTVLRKNKNSDSSRERELEEELITMRATETQLSTNIQVLTAKIETLEKQKDILADDNMNLQKRSKELIELIEDTRTQNDFLNKEIQQYIQQQHETLKRHQQQIESMDNCHKEQLQSLNASHQRQLDQLRSELSTRINLPPTVETAKSSVAHEHIDQSIDFLLMEREDAEGSEEAVETLANLAASRKISNDSSSAKRTLHDCMPLDELLNTPLNAINIETLITNSQHNCSSNSVMDTNNSVDFLQLELNSTKERLQKQETRVRHLTALLAENEQDLAKLTQMNEMLKEELRRQERSVEREQHMHNSEYVKNVIMKFLTLNNADEKTRLVPVLNTILKLSRSEAEMLNCVAKGQKVSEATQRTGGWGNFLPWGNNSNNN